MRRLALGAFVGALAVVGVARADDPPATLPTSLSAERELRLYDVGALTGTSPDFQIEQGPYPMDGREWTCNAEESGAVAIPYGERAERHARLGSIDDVIELVKSAMIVEDPTSFSRDGEYVFASGPGCLAIYGAKLLQERAAVVLAGFERRELPAVVIDVIALRGAASAARESGLVSAVESGALTPLAGARAVGFVPRTIAARSGSECAFVSDEDVVVAEHAKATDPEIGVAKRGLAFEATLQRATPERVNVQLTAWWADAAPPRLVEIQPSGDPLETVVTDGRRVDAVLDLVPGVWTPLSGGGNVLFAVRASVRPHEVPPARGVLVPTPTVAPKAPFSAHGFDVKDLLDEPLETRGEVPRLHQAAASSEAPSAPDEGRLVFPSGDFLETLKLCAPAAWMPEGTSIDLRGGTLELIGDDAMARATGEFLDGFRASFGRSTRLRATVVSLPITSCPEYLAGLDDGAALLADGGKALLARAGASILDRGGLTVRSGQRVASVAGTRHTYVGDYDIAISKGVVIGKPVMHRVLAGFSFDVEGRLVADGAAIACDLRIDRSTWGESRRRKTSHGELECPTLGVSRIRGGTVLPLGGQRIVGATLEAGIVTLTILSASRD